MSVVQKERIALISATALGIVSFIVARIDFYINYVFTSLSPEDYTVLDIATWLVNDTSYVLVFLIPMLILMKRSNRQINITLSILLCFTVIADLVITTVNYGASYHFMYRNNSLFIYIILITIAVEMMIMSEKLKFSGTIVCLIMATSISSNTLLNNFNYILGWIGELFEGSNNYNYYSVSDVFLNAIPNIIFSISICILYVLLLLQSVRWHCPDCDYKNDAKDNFCGGCGKIKT